MIIDSTTTKTSGGAIAGYPFEIDITVIICINMITKKYRLASLLVNCANKLNGMKVNRLYLEVRTLLLLTFFCFRKFAKALSSRSIVRIFLD